MSSPITISTPIRIKIYTQAQTHSQPPKKGGVGTAIESICLHTATNSWQWLAKWGQQPRTSQATILHYLSNVLQKLGDLHRGTTVLCGRLALRGIAGTRCTICCGSEGILHQEEEGILPGDGGAHIPKIPGKPFQGHLHAVCVHPSTEHSCTKRVLVTVPRHK